jgi:hypothetical protein
MKEIDEITADVLDVADSRRPGPGSRCSRAFPFFALRLNQITE